jgi:succinoglycan biosynthesis protein ExoA
MEPGRETASRHEAPDIGDCADPSVTLVVAMRNEASTIEGCLASIAAQDYPPGRIEVLIYDGGSVDASLAIARAFASGRPRWAVRENPRRIQAAAWNAGISAASSQIVGIVSGHTELGPAYIRSAVHALTGSGADMVGGPVRAVAHGAIGAAIAIATSTPYGVGGATHHYTSEPAFVDTVFMGVARRSTWLRYPFDEAFVRNQDDELSYRLRDDGGRILCDPAIESRYRSRQTLRALWRQYADYGLWKVRVLQAHPRQARIRHLIPVTLVATLGGSVILGPASRKARAVALLELCLYVTATAIAAGRYRDRNNPASAVWLAVTFPVMHFAYGTGMLRGAWRFRRMFARPPQLVRPSAAPEATEGASSADAS